MAIVEELLKEKKSPNSLLENVRIREFMNKDGEDVQRIYVNSMLSNVSYALGSTMQHRHILCLWIGLTYLTVKNHTASHITLMLLVFIGWGIFLYVNASRFITNSISYETRQAIHNELYKIQENYGKTKSEKQHKSHSAVTDLHSADDESSPSDEKISRFWVAVDKRSGNRVIGFLALKDGETKRRKILEHEPQIKYLCVDTNYMRQGVATSLLEHAIKFARRKQMARIGVTISTWHEPAKELFYRFGFIEIMREAMAFGLAERMGLSLDVKSWNRYRKARKSVCL